jgi:ferrous-iron efflux pump FieF
MEPEKKRVTDVLLDRSPAPLVEQIDAVLKQATGITRYHELRVRTSGAENYIEVNIHVQPGHTLEKAHEISHLIEKQIQDAVPRSFVYVHIEPDKHQPDTAWDQGI